MALSYKASPVAASSYSTKRMVSRLAWTTASRTRLTAASASYQGGAAVPGYSLNPADKNGHQIVLSENAPYIDVCLAGSMDDACWFGDFPGRVTLDLPEEQLPAALAVFEHMHTDALPHDWELLAKMCHLAFKWQLQPTLEACLTELCNQVAAREVGVDPIALVLLLPEELLVSTAGGRALLREMRSQSSARDAAA